ncbi:SURF1 family protein [Saccharomonospora sp. CUA-673]|uniref:SURF1 family cytochrome oxidase biogenesis protein n=1 Tax=Saccharomonospora sp. CUA-673 TaxID=1904969 RepID=UPI00096AA0CE|nr:SURF1 family cytochrome oxidase biogenesis protein [Saccharomonospora sp. CUA-673]
MRWKFLLKPGWLALTVVVFLFAALCFSALAPWQFHRHDERALQNEAVSTAGDPVPLHEVLPGDTAPDGDTQWERVTIEGTYLPDDEVIARLRTVQGEPAFEVLTPLRTSDGEVVLINRGYVRPDDNTGVGPVEAPPQGPVTVSARVRVDEDDPGNRDAFADESTEGRMHAYSVDSRVVARATDLDIRPGYFQLETDQPGVLTALPLPQLQQGPFFSYALQWVAFGVMALLGWLYFTIREARPGGVLAGPEPGEKSDSAAQDGPPTAGDEHGERATEKRPATKQQPKKSKRKSVAQILAEDEEAERQASAEAGSSRH